MRKVKGNRIEAFFSLASFGIFAASMLVVLLFGASIYKSSAEKSEEGRDEKICLSYIWSKAKSGDTRGNVYAGEFSGLPALYLEEEYGDTTYATIIYLYEGWVRELFHETGLELFPEDGIQIVKADSLGFEQLEDGLIKANVNSEHMFIYPRCAE